MSDYKEIAQAYVAATRKGQYAEAVRLVYPGDLDKFKTNVLWCARAMQPFGETQEFLEVFGDDTEVEDLEVLHPEAFLARFLEGAYGKQDIRKMDDVLQEFEVTKVESKDEDTVLIQFRFSIHHAGKKITDERDMTLQQVGDDWFVLMRDGMTSMHYKTREQIQLFRERESKDKPDAREGHLSPTALWGFKDDEDKTIIEPRFREVGEFENGLAPAKFFRKWGFIGTDGTTRINPRFDAAEKFSEELAAVGVRNENWDMNWGFVNASGELVVEHQFVDAKQFSEGLAAVATRVGECDQSWGYIDSSGTMIIDFQFSDAGDFEDGEAEVAFEREDEYVTGRIDLDGKFFQD